ncbi:MAG: hypothetical protein NTU93_16040 [Arthrobacter sp.]|nr:hypothetical protein [Arthrobacter sp.]
MTDDNLLTIATYGRSGSSARVRIHDWLGYLGISARHLSYTGQANNSISTLLSHLDKVVHSEVSLSRLAANGFRGTILMSREASPFSNGRLEAKILRAADRSVYDFDDAIFHSSAPFPYSLWPKDKLWLRSIQAASHVIAGNEYLAEEASKHARDVTLVPSCVDMASYTRKTDFDLRSTPTLVWLGSPATEPYLETIADALLRVNSVTPIRLTVISAGRRSLGPLDEIVDRVDWSEGSFGGLLQEADLGIMPLPDNEFARGKCAYKLLQYGAAGLPVMGSPVGANSGVLARMDGFSASSTAEWAVALQDFLASTASERKSKGDTGYTAIAEGFSFSAWKETWQKVVGLTPTTGLIP